MMYSKEQIIDEIRRVATKLNKSSLRQKDFSHYSSISTGTVKYHFGSWNEAVKSAELIPIDPKEHIKNLDKNIPDDELLKDLIRLYIEYGKQPTRSLVNAKGKYSHQPYRVRWENLKEAFLIAQKRFPSEDNIKPEMRSGSPIISEGVKVIPETIKPKKMKRKRVVFGEPIDFRGLRFAPVNEQGVVYLFGMISQELGYLIESIRTEYPDCEGKRCFDKVNNKWEHIQIEFEYKSSNFREHGHNPAQCDVIVCWEHDWEGCPIEVLELKEIIRFL